MQNFGIRDVGNDSLSSKSVLLFQVMFPSTLLGTGEDWTLMKTISVTEYLNYEAGQKTISLFYMLCYMLLIY